jgi:hypothetical protein
VRRRAEPVLDAERGWHDSQPMSIEVKVQLLADELIEGDGDEEADA